MVSLSLFLPEAQEDFSDISSGNLVQFLDVNLTVSWGPPHDWVPLGFLTPQVVHFQLSTVHHSSGFLPQCRFLRQFLIVSSISGKLWCLYSHVSSVLGQHLPCVLLSVDPRSVEFSVCVAFYLLLGQSSNFQAPYNQNWLTLKFPPSLIFKNCFPAF